MPMPRTIAFIATLAALASQVAERPARETVTIPGETDQYFLNRVTQVSVGPDGRVLVVDPGEMVIRQFDSLGRYVGAIGRRGRGPGEFQSIAVGWLADTLYAIDAALGRVSYFDGSGKFLRDSLLPRFDLPDAKSSLVVVRLLRGGRAIGIPPITSRGSDPRAPLVRPVAGLGPAGVRRLATIGVWPGEVILIAPPRQDWGPILVPGSPLGRLVTRGHLWTTTPSGTLLLANADPAEHEFVVTAITFDGDTAFRRVFGYDPMPVPERLVDSLVLRQARVLRGIPLRVAERSVRDAFRPIKDFPPVSHVLASADGQIWIGREDIPGRPRRWVVLDAAGRPQFTTATPPGFSALAVGPDWIWGVVADSVGVPSVRKFVVK
jgi:hypothetical protein